MSRPLVASLALVTLCAACTPDAGRELGESQSTSTEGSGADESSTSGPGDPSTTTTETGDPSPGTETGTETSGDGDGDALPFCGDGVLDEGEACDDGVNDGSYGGCNPGCMSLAAHCGDGVVNGPESCDDADEDPGDGCLSSCVVTESCALIHELEPDLSDGFYTLIPPGYEGEPFQVYCDMSTEGGGWAVIFKNHGGAVPGERSNDTLLDGDPGPYGSVILPHTLALESGVNPEAWAWYRDAAGHEWLKYGTLYGPDDQVVVEQQIRADFGEAVTWSWILSRPSLEACHLAPNPIVLTLNGGTPLGQTTYVNSYQSERRTFGLANAANLDDRCGQPDNNLINDPEQGLAWLDGYSVGGIRHFFSYVHTATGTDSSRCQFACWSPESAGYYDGFTWMVR